MTSIELKQAILDALAELVKQTSDVRFGQLIANLVVIARGPNPDSVWDMEDDELLAATKIHLEDFARHHARVYCPRNSERIAVQRFSLLSSSNGRRFWGSVPSFPPLYHVSRILRGR